MNYIISKSETHPVVIGENTRRLRFFDIPTKAKIIVTHAYCISNSAFELNLYQTLSG